jgi:chromosome segregation protein
MRLTHIKLAGFKSFTDPTTIHVPGQLVAVIGPNGCGKSNVIDAVRWVLGEASAKQLRGESMQDVIFNGAATRRPAARAHRWSLCSTMPTKPCKARGGNMPK